MSLSEKVLSPHAADELIQALEGAANFIRGAAIDQRIPGDARSAFVGKARELESSAQKALLEIENDAQ